MLRDPEPTEPRDDITARLGVGRGGSICDELAAHDLVAVDRVELARLRAAAEGYRRIAELVDGPDEPLA